MNEWIADYAVLWTIGTVLFGFQLAAFSWRISRELKMEAKNEPTWFTCADWMVIVSSLILVTCVFILPILTSGGISIKFVVFAFGLALLTSSLAPLVVAGHYNLLIRSRKESWDEPQRQSPRHHSTVQERWALGITIAIITVYLVLVPVSSGMPQELFAMQPQETKTLPPPASTSILDCDRWDTERTKMAWDIVKNNRLSALNSNEYVLEEVNKVAQGLEANFKNEQCP